MRKYKTRFYNENEQAYYESKLKDGWHWKTAEKRTIRFLKDLGYYEE